MFVIKKNHPVLKFYRRRLRKRSTPAEQHLWHHLRDRRLGGWRFVRQYSVDFFILDFYCPAAKLAVEVDGGHHGWTKYAQADAERTAWLEAQGICVVRFWNNEVLKQTESVLMRLLETLGESNQTNCNSLSADLHEE